MPEHFLVFERRSRIEAPAAELFAWHLRPGAFERLTPPGDGTRVTSRTGRIEDDTFRVELSVPLLGRIRQTWRARHEGYIAGERFIDVMELGPFAFWRHEHRAVPISSRTSELLDHVDYALPLGLFGRIAGQPIVERRLKRMFDHRHAVTAADLAAHQAAALGTLDVRVDGAGHTDLGTQLVAFLLTGGHNVASNATIVGYEPRAFERPDVQVTLARETAHVELANGASSTGELTGDPVEDPRRVLAAIVALRRSHAG
jgi:ligand-binding SRPBCC domain-containing protein